MLGLPFSNLFSQPLTSTVPIVSLTTIGLSALTADPVQRHSARETVTQVTERGFIFWLVSLRGSWFICLSGLQALLPKANFHPISNGIIQYCAKKMTNSYQAEFEMNAFSVEATLAIGSPRFRIHNFIADGNVRPNRCLSFASCSLCCL